MAKRINMVPIPLGDLARAIMGAQPEKPAVTKSESQVLADQIEAHERITVREGRRLDMMRHAKALIDGNKAVREYVMLRDKIADENLGEGEQPDLHDPEDCGDADCPVHGAGNKVRG